MVAQEDIRVLLADDHTMVRQGLSQILEDSEGICVVGQAADGRQALELVASARPQLVVLDYSMPNMDGPATIERLQRDFPEVKILMLTIHDNIHYAVRVLELGAHGYVMKSAAAHELVEAIRTVHKGEIYISPEVSHKVIQHMWGRKKNRSGLASLSQREFELLRVFGAGMSLKDCAEALNINTSTVSTYRSRLMEKLHLKNTAEIIRFALENNIIG